jgi:hypothetical protein
MRFLEVPGADLGRGNLRGNGEHGHTRSVAVKEAIDKMQIARSAAAADREITRKMRLRTRSKGRDLLVPDMNPFDLFLATTSQAAGIFSERNRDHQESRRLNHPSRPSAVGR